MFSRFSRSWELVKASGRVLRADKELIVFPIISGIALLLVLASFAVPFVLSGGLELIDEGRSAAQAQHYVLLFLFYLVQYFIIFFFNTALVGAAMIRLNGGDPNVWDGLRIAGERVSTIFGYALLSATVGMLLRWLSERVGIIGNFIISLVGVVWSVATYLVIPVIVVERVGAVAAVKRSSGLLRQTWGEQIVGNLAIGTVFALPMVLLILLGVFAGFLLVAAEQMLLALAVIVFCVVGVMALALIQSTLSGIYAAAVYRYAATGQVSPGFDSHMIAEAFRHK